MGILRGGGMQGCGSSRRDASGMEGRDGGDEGGGGAERASACVGYGRGLVHSRARRRIAQPGARVHPAALPVRRAERRHRMGVHSPLHVVPDGVRPPHAGASHKQVRLSPLSPLSLILSVSPFSCDANIAASFLIALFSFSSLVL